VSERVNEDPASFCFSDFGVSRSQQASKQGMRWQQHQSNASKAISLTISDKDDDDVGNDDD